MWKLLLAANLARTILAAELPVRTVILYKHGVGYFERAGELRSGESARLDFKASDMNDVLKSLTIQDKSGAKITGLRYDASEPLEKRLEDYPFRLGHQQALSQFLDQLKGARIEIRTAAGETLTGSLFSGRLMTASDKTQEKEQLVLLLDSGDLRTYDLSAIVQLKLADDALQRQLKAYLAALSVARSREKRSVYVDSSDARSRQVIASYMIPTPVWKSSYRLILKDGQSMLEGWAIIDNTTGEDWTNVTVALVSGRPISFISRLYEPKYRIRPEAELAEDRALAPTVYSGAVEQRAGALAGIAGGPQRMAKSAAPPRSPQTMEMAAVMADAPARDELTSSIANTAHGRDLGDLFEYRFGTAVTVRKSESAMLPFLQQNVGARKLLIYSGRSLQNPFHAAEITNSTGKTLDGGPITVFEAGAYAGEALVETVKAGDKRLISFGVDLGTRITTAFDSSRDLVREIRARRGVFTTKVALQETQTYTIHNVDARPKTLLIEHPVRAEYKLLHAKPLESTATAHRFEVKLSSNATEKFAVAEERVYEQGYGITSLTFDQLGVFLQNRSLSAEARKQLEAIAAHKRQIADTDRSLKEVDQDINELVRDQERIRQNLSSLNRVTGQTEQVNKYARELADQESKLAGMRDRLSQLRKQKAAQEQALHSLIERIEF
ncbi:MAG TPA: DUF4139 domain-containing protein [Bryobacteraceae bacterium]|nr:DUF4139 domain-containing protein [Bryobacteraceae bacterium]